MAAYDSQTLAFKRQGTSIKLRDGTNPNPLELTLYLLSGSLTYSETGRNKVEVKNNDRRLSTPTVVETGDTEITGSLSVLVSSFKGTSSGAADTAIRDWMLGNVPSFVSRGKGGAPQLQMICTYDNREDDGAGVTQTATFGFVTFDEISIDTGGADDLVLLTASFTAREVGSRPTYV